METKTTKQVDLFGFEIPQKEPKVEPKKEVNKVTREIPQEQPIVASFRVNRRELMYGLIRFWCLRIACFGTSI